MGLIAESLVNIIQCVSIDVYLNEECSMSSFNNIKSYHQVSRFPFLFLQGKG